MRATGQWSVEPEQVARVVERHGRLVVGPAGELMVELAGVDAAQAQALELSFGQEVLLAP